MSGNWIGILLFALQLPPLPPHDPAPPLRTVTGTVVNAVTGEPLRRALVILNAKTVLTGPDGRFQIDQVPEGAVLLTLQKQGYFDSRFVPTGQQGQGQLGITVGAGKNDFRLQLYPAARITGRITNKEGEPVEAAPLQVLAEQIIDGRKRWQANTMATSDEDGLFRLSDLVPNRYIVFFAGHAAPAQDLNAGWNVNPPVYYPDASDLASAQPMELRAGEEMRVDLRVRTERGYSINGSVSGTSANWVNLNIENSEGQTIQTGATQFNQTARQLRVVGVPSGRWTLYFQANDTEGHLSTYQQEIAVNHSDVVDLPIRLHPLASIPVTVNHAVKPPADGAVPSFYAAVNSVDSAHYVQNATFPQGDPPTLQIANVAPAKYRFQVPAAGTECVESAWFGSVDLTREFLVIGDSGGVTQPIVVNMQDNCPTLNVHVHAKENRKSGFVLVIPANNTAAAIVVWPWSGIGAISNKLSPGSYQVYAISDINGLEYANPEALRGYPSQTVTLQTGQTADVTLDSADKKGN